MITIEEQIKILKYCKSNKIRLIHLEYYLTFPSICYEYALDVLKGRFELAEPHISKDAWVSYVYACDVLGSRFELAEPIIEKSHYWEAYKKNFNI